jgi:secretion/DNA translocation related TadE-like protein
MLGHWADRRSAHGRVTATTRLAGPVSAGEPDRAGERGAASILLLAIGLVLVAGGIAGAAVGEARVARHRAQTAADLGALAGAVHVLEGPASACAAAQRLVSANDGVLVDCEIQELDLIVHVEVTAPHLPGPARAAARAGPVSTPVSGGD